MGKVVEIGITKKKGDKIQKVDKVEAIKGKGLLYDRHFKVENIKKCQITLIEIENINEYNKNFSQEIPALNFRRNIVTENIKLNNLIGKEFYIGQVKVKGVDLCRPCKHLQELLKQTNIVKEFLQKGGLRCEILISGTIHLEDEIKII